MKINAVLEARLAEAPSPFSDAVLPNAFRDTPDVPAIHADVRSRLLQLIHESRADERASLQVVTGDAGEGKTHLIAWLRRISEAGWRSAGTSSRFAVAVVPPLRSLERARHHVLQELVTQLGRSLPNDIHVDRATDTPIEILLWRALLSIARRVADSPATDPAFSERLRDLLSSNPDKYLSVCVDQLCQAWPFMGPPLVRAAMRMPELGQLDREVFRVLARFPEGDDARRAEIVDWLGGASLPADRIEALGSTLVLDDEAEAARGLTTLLALARLADIPVVLAFDQIEATERLGADAVSTFLAVVAELYNECPGAIIVVFCQTQLWPRLRESAAEHVRDRLDSSPVINLKALTPIEGLALVEKRLSHFWNALGEKPPNTLYPLTRDQVLAEIEGARLRTPRAVMRYFQALLRESPEKRSGFSPPAEPTAIDVVKRKLTTLLEDERRGPARAPDSRASIAHSVIAECLRASRDRARTVANAVVESADDLRLRKTSVAGIRVAVRRGNVRRVLYVETSNSQHGKSAASTTKRLSDAVSGGHADQAILIREDAFPLPPAAKATLVDITPRGVIIWLRERELTSLAALEALLNAAAAHDIPVDRATALDLALEQLDGTLGIVERLVEAAFDVERPESPPSDDDELTKLVESYLKERCAFEPLSQLAESLRLSIEKVHVVVQLLAKRGRVEIVADRNRAQIVLLRPEGFA